LGLIVQRVSPPLTVRQHVLKPGLPQVDCLAHRATSRLHSFDNSPALIAFLTWRTTHRT